MTKSKILIVEDESVVAEDLLHQLVEMGYQPVAKTARAEDAILLADRLRPDLVLMDIHLAGDMSGTTAATIIHDRYDIPVIFMTAYADEETLAGAKQSDPFGYILKPFEGRELRIVMEMAIYKHRAEILMQQDRRERAAILSNSLDGFWLVESPGLLKDMNEACCRMHGYTREEMLGRPASDFESKETTGEILGDIDRIKQRGGALYEGKHRHKDGHLFDVEVSINALPGGKGLYSSFLRDITVRKQLEAALRSSEEQATKTFHTIPDGIVLSRIADGQVLEVNEAFSRLSGWSREDAIGHSILELDLWDQLTERDAYLAILHQKGRVEGMEAVFRTKSGERRSINLSAELMEHGQEKLVLAVAHDITKRKELEYALRQAEERTTKAFLTIPDGIVISRLADSVVLEVNDSFCELSGLPREAVLGRPLAELDLWDQASDRDLFLKGLQEQGRVRGLEAGFHNKFGAHRIMALSAELMDDNHEKLVLIVAHDITERKQTEAALKEGEATYRSILDASPDDITITDMEGRILLISAAASAMFGYAPGEEIGMQLLEFIVPEDVERARANLALMHQAEAHAPHEYRGIRKDRSTFDIEVMSGFIRGANGQLIKMVFIVRDITERKRVDTALRENEDRYRDLVENAQELISTYDLDGNILSTNETTVRNTGYSREVLLKMNLMGLVAPETRHLVPAYYKALEEDGKAHGILRIQTASGEKRFWEYDSTVRTEGLDRPIVRGMSVDITDRRAAEKALRANESQLQVILESTDDGILAVDLKGRVLKTNRRFAELWNIPESVIASGDRQMLLDHVLPQLSDPEAFLARAQSLNASDEQGLDRILFKDGRCFERLSTPMRDQQAVTGRVSSFRDITERMRSEESIKESEDRYRDLVDNSQEVVATYDLEGNFLSVNETAVRSAGYSREALLKMNLIDLVAPKMRALFPEYSQVLRTKGKAHGIMQIQNASGEVRFWEYESTLRTEGVAKPIVRGMALDITERRLAERALKANETQLRVILESTDDGILAVNQQGKILKTNHRFAEIWKIPQPLIEGGDDQALLAHVLDQLLDPAAFRDKVKSLYASEATDLDLITFKDGRCFERFSSPMLEGSTVLGRVWSFRDITERKQAEQKLKENEKMLREAQAIAGLGSYVLDIPSGIWRSSGVLDNLFGIDALYPRTVEGWTNLIHPEERQMMADYFAHEVVGNHQRFNKEYRIIRQSDQAVRWVYGQGELAFTNESLLVNMHGTIQDITERKLAEQALQASEERFRTMFSGAPLGIAAIDSLTGKIFELNQRFAEIAGRTLEEMTDIDWMQITHPDDVQPDLDNMALLNAGKIRGFQMETRYLHPDGTVVWIDLTTAPLPVEDKGHPHHLAMIQDITERKQADQAVRDQARELTERNLALSRFNRIAVDRELRMIELKKEVNELCGKLGEPIRHQVMGDDTAPLPPIKAQP